MAFKQVQAQPFFLAGAGAVAGATSITLKSFNQIDGTPLVMSNFGVKGYLTIEPGNNTLEEQVSFTGVTQNANGTATLTGIKNVTMVFPYTETSGLSITHAGSSTVILSNTSGFYSQFLASANDETITGTWTFTNPNYPRMDTATPFPTDNEQLVTKAYADSLTFAGAPNATTTQKGIVQLATQAQVDAKTLVGSTGADLVATPDLARSTLLSDYVLDTGAANVYAIAPSPAISAYTAGQRFTWMVLHTNTAASTLNVNGKGAIAIKKINGSTALVANDLVAGMIVETEYDGINFQLISTSANAVNFNGSGQYPAADGSLITNLVKYVQKLDIVTTPVTVASTTAETTIYTKSIAGGLLSTSNGLRLKLLMKNLITSDVARTFVIKVKYGGSTLVTTTASNTTDTFMSGYLEVDVLASGATNSQVVTATGVFARINTPGNSISVCDVGTGAIDSTATQTLAVTITFSNSGTEDSVTVEHAILELIQ